MLGLHRVLQVVADDAGAVCPPKLVKCWLVKCGAALSGPRSLGIGCCLLRTKTVLVLLCVHAVAATAKRPFADWRVNVQVPTTAGGSCCGVYTVGSTLGGRVLLSAGRAGWHRLVFNDPLPTSCVAGGDFARKKKQGDKVVN